MDFKFSKPSDNTKKNDDVKKNDSFDEKNDCIYAPKREVKNIYYDKNGKEIKADSRDSTSVFAASEQIDNGPVSYYCLFDDRGGMYDFTNSKEIKSTNSDKFVMRKIKERAFKCYIRYLEKRTVYLYNNARRENM